MVLLGAAAQVCGQTDKGNGEELAEFNLLPLPEEQEWHLWARSPRAQLWVQELGHTEIPARQSRMCLFRGGFRDGPLGLGLERTHPESWEKPRPWHHPSQAGPWGSE